MDVFRELQKLRGEFEQKHTSLTSQVRSEMSRFNSETKTILNELDNKIAEKVHEEVTSAFSEIKILFANLKIKVGAHG